MRTILKRAGLAGALLSACLFHAPGWAEDVKPVKIGVLTDMSGMYRDIMGPGSILAAQMAVADFGGKVLGRPIQVISADHQAKPDLGSSIAREWFDTKDVPVIVDIAQSAVALGIQEVAKSRQKVVMHGVTGSPAITQDACIPTAFSWSLNAYALNAPLPELADQAGSRHLLLRDGGLLLRPCDAGRSGARDQGRRAARFIGTTLFPQHNSDFSSFLVQAQASGAKVVYLVSAAGDTTTALKQAAEFGLGAGGPARRHAPDLHHQRARARAQRRRRAPRSSRPSIGTARRRRAPSRQRFAQGARWHADHGSCRRLLGDVALPAGGGPTPRLSTDPRWPKRSASFRSATFMCRTAASGPTAG